MVAAFYRSSRTHDSLLALSLTVALPGSRNSFEFRFEKLEARVGIEPTHRGFADLGLTTWLPRRLLGGAELAGKKTVRKR